MKKLIKSALALAMAVALTLSYLLVSQAVKADDAGEAHVHGEVEYQPTDEFPTSSGFYYLTTDIKVSSDINLYDDDDVTLCLNGHTIDFSKSNIYDACRVRLNTGSKLTIIDHEGQNGKIITNMGNLFYMLSGSLSLKNVSIESRGTGKSGYSCVIGSDDYSGNIDIDNCNIFADDYNAVSLAKEGNLNIRNSKIKCGQESYKNLGIKVNSNCTGEVHLTNVEMTTAFVNIESNQSKVYVSNCSIEDKNVLYAIDISNGSGTQLFLEGDVSNITAKYGGICLSGNAKIGFTGKVAGSVSLNHLLGPSKLSDPHIVLTDGLGDYASIDNFTYVWPKESLLYINKDGEMSLAYAHSPHNWTIKETGDPGIVSIYCSEENCAFGEKYLVGLILEMKAESKEYDGTPVIATLEKSGHLPDEIDVSEISYYSGDTLLDSAPYKKGTYVAKAHVVCGNFSKDITKEYTISHNHNWEMVKSKEGNSLDVRCSTVPCEYGNDPFNITLSAPKRLTSGEPCIAELVVDDNLPSDVTLGEIKYYDSKDNLLDAAPSESGFYTAKVNVMVENRVEIISVNFTVFDIKPNSLVYDGESHYLLSNKDSDDGYYYYRLGENGKWQYTIPRATYAGTYKVYWYFKSKDGTHDYGSGENPNLITVEIDKCPIVIQGVKVKDKKYDGNKDATLDYNNKVFVGKALDDSLLMNYKAYFEDEKVGNNKKVLISDYSLYGEDAVNYKLADSGHQTEATGNILPKYSNLNDNSKTDDKNNKGDNSKKTSKVTKYSITAVVKALKNKRVKVKWSKINKASRYVVYIAKNKKRSKYKIVKIVSAKKFKYIIKKLKANKKYKIKVAAQQKVNGKYKTLCTSKVRKVKTKKR